MTLPRRFGVVLSVGVLVGAAVAVAGSPAQAAVPGPTLAATTTMRSFTCSGSLGEAFTRRTVTGRLTYDHVPTAVTVTRTATGTVDSARTRRAAPVGPSALHAGYTEWDVTGRTPNGDTFHLSVPPVLPGDGGFFDADLEIQFAGGANGGWQIPMVDCTVTGGPAWMVTPTGTRALACTGSLGDPVSVRTVTASLDRLNRPSAVTVLDPTGAPQSSRRRPAATGPSWLHAGYVQWDVTGRNPAHDLFTLHLPPVLPAAGGFTDADLEIQFSGGTAGGLQIPMVDCTVT